ncbi:hydrogenase nickel incorporation protein HypB [Ammoniphilus resinae]|uniref:Hydrogenase nickel incorporation protein HypB n=1 Tax=Ammoniphilus resinae TaxID=861532 RepID=A0ABS4GLX4_9BACL|nr:hydrogenase nickel incorporation protein HypB [Ammoniphilus resinae]MBP1931107.1 hydrogenase nickel incorporation protein HypB [Ammoniphilus resinae]
MKQITLKQQVLQGNKIIADKNRQILREHSVFMINLMSSPGAGKTTLLESSLPYIKKHVRIGVIEGDVATTLDAERIAAFGVNVAQINTHGACHLDAQMISRALASLDLNNLDLLVIENVGNLVCPSEFDLGENLRVSLLSITEGADKVMKYPSVFAYSDAVILNKLDLLPYVNFDMDQFLSTFQKCNPSAPIFKVSASNGEGMESWIRWLLQRKEDSCL